LGWGKKKKKWTKPSTNAKAHGLRGRGKTKGTERLIGLGRGVGKIENRLRKYKVHVSLRRNHVASAPGLKKRCNALKKGWVGRRVGKEGKKPTSN